MLQRILKISGFVLLLVALSGAGGAYLLHLNRNRIVDYFSSELSRHTDVKIDIRNTSIGFRQGITFDLLDIHARTGSGNFELKAPRIHIRLKLLPLLRGDIVSTWAELRKPEIVWHLAACADASDNVDSSSIKRNDEVYTVQSEPITFMLSAWRRIVCRDARIEVHPGEHAPLNFSAANLSLKQEKEGNPIEADLSGLMHTGAQADPVQILMETRLEIPSIPDTHETAFPLSKIDISTSLQLKNINIAEVNRYLPPAAANVSLQGKVGFTATFNGSLNRGVDLKGRIHAPKTNSSTNPLAINYSGSSLHPGDIELTATVQHSVGRTFDISSLKLKSDLVSAQGSVHITRDEMKADIVASSASIGYAQLSPWMDDTPAPLKNRLHDGRITCTELYYSGPINPPEIAGIKSSHWQIDLPSLLSMNATDKASPPPRFTLEHRGNKVNMRSSTLKWDGDFFSAETALDMEGEWDIQKECFAVNVDLSQSSAKGGGVSIKDEAIPAQLRFTFHPRPDGWEISAANLKSPELNVSCSAEVTQSSDFSAHLKLRKFNLESLRKRIPILAKMELGGEIDLNYSLRLQGTDWDGKGDVVLHDCSIAPADILGRIHHINGTANIDGFAVNAPGLRLLLGEDNSPMQVSATIEDVRHPVADIHASGDGVVANDLIFASRTAKLYNLGGNIRIHADGIDFVSAQVDLEQGTHAEVQGVLGFSTPDLDLDIHATYADIDEVIALWNGDGTQEPHPSEHEAGDTVIPATLPSDETLFIDASVDTGVFSGFAFRDAEGRINIQREQLRIEPLEFYADNGQGDGKIIVRTTPDPYLKISGSLKNINADKVYTQIFEDLGLITGALDGTFSLHGPIGPEFSANTAGDFKVDVRDGVLRKFKFLSKVFSLLNVAQLFKMQLPDMASEGMPFKRLSADLSMEKGVLHSNNLLIRSEAMNIALAGEFSLPNMQIDAAMALNPLGTVDSIFSKIPVAGWLLTGDKKAFITVEFDISGPAREPLVSMKPLSSVSNQMFGILKRTITLPGTTLMDPGKVFFHQGKKEDVQENESEE
jgi:hypothetical protein